MTGRKYAGIVWVVHRRITLLECCRLLAYTVLFAAALRSRFRVRVVVNAPDEAWLGSRRFRWVVGRVFTTVEGSNRWNEFSGWVEGIEALRGTAGQITGAWFANDSMLKHARLSVAQVLDVVNASIVGCQALSEGRRSIVGFLHSPLLPVAISQRTVCCYVNTRVFFMSDASLFYEGKELDEIGSAIDWLAWDRYVAGPRKVDYVGYELLFRTWLNGERGSVHWYRAGGLTADNAARFKTKAATILMEHCLSERVREAGGEVRGFPRNVSDALRTVAGIRKWAGKGCGCGAR